MSRPFISHQAAQANTVHEPVELAAPTGIVAGYKRSAGGFYQVVRAAAQKGVGLYRVLVDGREVGRQVSPPSADDCARLEREGLERPAPSPARTVVYGYYTPRPTRRGRPRKVQPA